MLCGVVERSLEISVLSTDCNFEIEKELLIERRDRVASFRPRIGVQCAVVGCGSLEFALLLEWLFPLELDGEYAFSSVLDVREQVVFVPFQSVCKEPVREISTFEEERIVR